MTKKIVPLINMKLATRNREIYEKQLRAAGPHLKQIRTMFGLSQQTLADILGLSIGLLNKIENGRAAFTMGTAFNVCVAFHISVEQLLRGWSTEDAQAVADKLRAKILRDQIIADIETDELAAKQFRVDHPETPAEFPSQLLAKYCADIRTGKRTVEEVVAVLKSWEPLTGADAAESARLLARAREIEDELKHDKQLADAAEAAKRGEGEDTE
jgi:transcriptional regulator with XRE-family HTH domain